MHAKVRISRLLIAIWLTCAMGVLLCYSSVTDGTVQNL